MQVLAMGNTCPYMPTTFRDFLKVAVELGRAVKPTSTNTSTVTEDLAAAAAAAENLMSLSSESDNKNTAVKRGGGGGGGGDAGGDGGGAPFAPALARRSSAPAETASAAGGEGDGDGDVVMGPPPPRGLPPAGKDQEDEDGDLGAVLPSSAPRVRRGPARIISAPVLGSGGGGGGSSAGVLGGRRRRRSSGGSPSGGGVSAGVVASGGGKDGDEDDVRQGEDPDSSEEEEEEGEGEGEVKADTSFFGVMSSLSQRSMRGLGLMNVRSSSPGLGLLTRQNTWSVGATKAPISEVYRKAQARDGINEMHPEVLNRRISSQEAGELDLSRSSSVLSSPSTAGVTPPPSNGGVTSSSTTLEGLLFGPGGLGNGSGSGGGGGGSKKKSAAPAPPPVGGGEAGGGDDDDASPAPALRGVRKQFSLDMNVNAGGAQSAGRVTENKSTRELAALLSNSSITEIAQMDGDVEVDIEPTDADNDIAIAAENGGSLVVGGGGGGVSLAGLDLSIVGSNHSNSQPRSRDASFENEGMMTPSPRSRNSSMMGESPSPSQILFTHEEIVVLKLLFSLFDRGGKNFITRDDIIAYAEEGGDFAQLKEVDSFMEAIDADTDGKVGLSDYINFAARLKGIHLLQQQMATD
ncbi:unnamed protein product [Ectocarpus sp. 8 AP-2014]